MRIKLSQPPKIRQQILARWAQVVALAALLAFAWLLLIPGDSKNALLLGLSALRLALAASLLLIALGVWRLGIYFLQTQNLITPLDTIIQRGAFWWLLSLCGLLASGGLAALLAARIVEHSTLQAYLLRLAPYAALWLLGWLGLAWALWAAYGAALLSAGSAQAGSQRRYLGGVMGRGLLNSLLALGLGLLLLNFYGGFRSLRNPAIYENLDDISLTPQEVLAAIEQGPLESRGDYLYRLNHLVRQGVAHYWEQAGLELYNMRIPSWENYVLWAASYINPPRYGSYELCDYRRAIERGVGLCSQYSLILAGILEDEGYPVRIAGLTGHMVAEAEVAPGQWWTLDSDHDAVYEMPVEQVQHRPDLVQARLLENGYPEAYAAHIAEVFGPEDNYVFENAGNGFDGGGKCVREEGFYALKWLLPLLMVSPFSIYQLRQRRRSDDQT